MPTDDMTISVEARTFGLWRIHLLAKWARWMPTPQWLIRLVVASAGVDIKAHAGPYPRKWQRTRLEWKRT